MQSDCRCRQISLYNIETKRQLSRPITPATRLRGQHPYPISYAALLCNQYEVISSQKFDQKLKLDHFGANIAQNHWSLTIINEKKLTKNVINELGSKFKLVESFIKITPKVSRKLYLVTIQFNRKVIENSNYR